MIRLETVNGEVLSKILRELTPIEFTSNRQVNRLLDGSYHIQIIGSPMKTIEGSIVSTHNQADKLNFLIDGGAELKLIFIHKKYIVILEDSIKWSRISFSHGDRDKSLFEGKLRMIIKEEVIT